MQLEDRFYKSTEVADLLGVSLRTLYRYMESDKIKSVHLPSGRHRFTKQQIEEFLYSNDLGGYGSRSDYGNAPVYSNHPSHQKYQVKPLEPSTPQQNFANRSTSSYNTVSSEEQFPSDEALDKQLDDLLKSLENDISVSQGDSKLDQPVINKDIDFEATTSSVPLSSFNAQDDISNPNLHQDNTNNVRSPEIYQEDDELDQLLKSLQEDDSEDFASSSEHVNTQPFKSLSKDTGGFSGFRIKPTTNALNENDIEYFYCPYNDLRTVAKTVKKIADDSGLKYAFTLNAGASLFFPLDPFSIIHFYVHYSDLDIWKKELQLNPSTKEDANIGILKTRGTAFEYSGEVSGLRVTSKQRLVENLKYHNLRELAEEVEKRL